ncbi:MAG TPA: hypothetical protein VGZ68_09825 [Acidimicrobiales bacterium]|jgi:hypothetical protein|nr:hypothetical protein [Acidimicrobiales bacterium]
MTDTSASANTIVRAALLKIDPEVTLRAADSLDLRAHAKVSAVVGVPLRQLQQRRDVTAFATTAPIAAVRGLLEVMALAPLEATIELLGDHADSPTYEQLSDAVDQLLASGSTNDDVVAVLAHAVGASFPAAPHCRRLLEERPELSLPTLPDVAAPTVLAAPKEVSAEIREQRKLRREDEKRKKKSASSARPPRPTKAKGGSSRPDTRTAAPTSAVPAPSEERRRLLLTPLESSRFDVEHPLVGAVIVVEVPFGVTDSDQPDVKSKDRPVLVVAASSEDLLVRPIYSNPSPARTLFQPWRRVGLDHVSYVADERVTISSSNLDPLQQLAQLTTPEWNSLT